MRGYPIEELIGREFGRWKILYEADKISNRRAMFCRCVCGNEKAIVLKCLLNDTSTSCGCFRRELIAQRSTTHGWAGDNRPSEYNIWKQMRQRCENPNAESYSEYGGRGIKVCERWRLFENFIADMGLRPSPKHSIERRENGGNYEPNNCVWATQKEQCRNTRANVLLSHNGAQRTIAEWAEITGFDYETIRARLARGWSESEAVSKPVDITKRPAMYRSNSLPI